MRFSTSAKQSVFISRLKQPYDRASAPNEVLIYGPYRMLETLMLAALLAAAALIIGCRRREKTLSIPFVPFIAAGSLATLIASIL